MPPWVPSNLTWAPKARPPPLPGRANARIVIASDPEKAFPSSQVSNWMRAIPFSATGRDWRICVRPRYDGLFCCSQRLKSQFAELSGPFVEKSSWKRTVVVIASLWRHTLTNFTLRVYPASRTDQTEFPFGISDRGEGSAPNGKIGAI